MFFASCLALSSLPAPIAAQSIPKDVKLSFDSFTGDSVLTTKYGRLDQPNGCGRTDIAIVWKRMAGRGAASEWLTYDWIMIDAPFSKKAVWLGGVSAFVNIDGEIVEGTRAPMTPQQEGGGKQFEESGQFEFPAGTLRRLADSRSPKLRIVGTNLTCDGVIEPNMLTRIRAMLSVGQ